MLWLKAWLETRWRIGFAAFMGVLLWGAPLLMITNVPAHDSQRILPILRLTMGNSGVLWALVMPLILAGSGIRTCLARPFTFEKNGDESTHFTLSLPVTRTRLFAVRSVAGILETAALLVAFTVSIWFLVPAPALSAPDDLRYLVGIGSWSLAAYAIAACVSLFAENGGQFRAGVLGLVVLFMLSFNGQLPGHARLRVLPPSIDIFRDLVAPLATHQAPWAAMIVAWALTIVSFAAALSLIRKRDY